MLSFCIRPSAVNVTVSPSLIPAAVSAASGWVGEDLPCTVGGLQGHIHHNRRVRGRLLAAIHLLIYTVYQIGHWCFTLPQIFMHPQMHLLYSVTRPRRKDKCSGNFCEYTRVAFPAVQRPQFPLNPTVYRVVYCTFQLFPTPAVTKRFLSYS